MEILTLPEDFKMSVVYDLSGQELPSYIICDHEGKTEKYTITRSPRSFLEMRLVECK